MSRRAWGFHLSLLLCTLCASCCASRRSALASRSPSFRAVVIPPGTACGFVGLGYVGCDFSFPCTTWTQGDVFMGPTRGSLGSQQAMFHEIGHNLASLSMCQ